MGTRSLVVFEEKDGTELAVVYRQYDGYPEGRGKELAQFLHGKRLVNGYGDTNIDQANGMGDLIAQWIAHEKVNNGSGPFHVGNVYVNPAGTRDMFEEYIYTVKPNVQGDGFDLTCYDVYAKDFVSIPY